MRLHPLERGGPDPSNVAHVGRTTEDHPRVPGRYDRARGRRSHTGETIELDGVRTVWIEGFPGPHRATSALIVLNRRQGSLPQGIQYGLRIRRGLVRSRSRDTVHGVAAVPQNAQREQHEGTPGQGSHLVS